MNSCDGVDGLSWIIKLVEQNERFERLPVQVLAEYAINITNRPEADSIQKYKNIQKNLKSSSAVREQKIISFLCSIATEPGENQMKFLEHMVKRLSTDSARVRNHAANLLKRTLQGEKMETDSQEDPLALGNIIVKLDILRGSKEAVGSLIKARALTSCNYIIIFPMTSFLPW